MVMLDIVQKHKSRVAVVISAAVFLFGVMTGPVLQAPYASAATNAELRAKAAELQAQINENNAHIKDLKEQAATLEGKLAELSAEMSNISSQIELTSVKIDDLTGQLDTAQQELDKQKDILKSSIRALYKKGGASTLELLASADSFSEFMNEQEYLERIKTAVQASAEQVIALKQQIESQKAEQVTLLAAQEGQRQTLASKQREQQTLLDITKGQAANFASAVETLRSQQAEINAQISVTGQIDYTQTSSYPWANYEPWSFNGCKVDPWGMCVRQCVSYTAWKVAQTGRTMPYWGGRGNANEWDDNARSEGIPVDRSPKAGDIAISNSGYYGHAMFVEAVLGDGRIRVSQFNYELQGRYSEMTINVGSLVFIHFPY
jgi:surface antigen